jgi:hypothetical protein
MAGSQPGSAKARSISGSKVRSRSIDKAKPQE